MRSITGPRLNLAPGPTRSGWRTVGSLLPYLWPKGDHGAQFRLVVACLFLVAAKLAVVAIPLVYSRVIDALAPKAGASWLSGAT